MSYDYRLGLRAKGIKSVRDKPLRTTRRPGDIEIVYDPKTRCYRRHVHRDMEQVK